MDDLSTLIAGDEPDLILSLKYYQNAVLILFLQLGSH